LITLSTTIHTTAIFAMHQNPETDSLKITQNDDGSYEMNWDKNDPAWKFLNHLTSAQIQIIMKEAIKDKLESL
jgi:hypothetical protein